VRLRAGCKQVRPVAEALAEEISGTARVIRINVDNQTELAAENGIRDIPTFIA
jgi:thioredoxin 1